MKCSRFIKLFSVKRNGSNALLFWIKGQRLKRQQFTNYRWPGHKNEGARILRLQRDYATKFFGKSRYGTVLLKYENFPLHVADEGLLLPERHRFGIKTEINVVLIRDVFNFLASYMKRSKTIIAMEKGERILKFWKEHAREYLGETNYLGQEFQKVPICYNKWQQDVEYRQELCVQLGVYFTDRNYRKVSEVGRGSSFDGIKFDGRADEMDVHGRWRHLATHPNEIRRQRYIDLLHVDPDIIELSNVVAGKIEGTEDL